ncbi:hypothetical protein R4282_22430 [Rhodococcus oxybenzonivorans]|uniref:hypothetical protein n=1 Tax=Rhodococcus oxybenzonivorans TaxID=1990687 RepID=UPI002954FA90|nr:hypothetical protein [Rhodococcus oxybenzonivorans]MDV7355753.1 hypothetical protein [Rhodococcus oxybenzonivorans]
MRSTAAVAVDHHQFLLSERDAEPLDPFAKGTVVEVGDGFVSFFAGITYGPVEVSVEVLDAAPTSTEVEQWEAVEETSIVADADIILSTLDGNEAPTVPPIPAGDYRVRVHARGRDVKAGLEVSEVVEHYLVQLWPNHSSSAPASRDVRTLRKIDQVWPLQPDSQVNVTSLSQDYVYVFDDDGNVITVPPQSPQAQAVRARLNTYGGKPLTPALEAVFSTRYVAGLDRALIDRVEATDPETQRAFARWCVHRAFEMAGIADIDRLRDVLTAMDTGAPPHPDFIDSFKARIRLDEDPRIIRTIVSGLPASGELVQQYQALFTYEVALHPDLGSLRAAIDAFWHAAMTFGMEYEQLTEAAHRDFFGDH